MFETTLKGGRGSDASTRIQEIFHHEQRLYRLVAERRSFTGVDFSDHATMWVSFASSAFTSCNFVGSHLENTFFDFARFEDCDFGDLNAFNVSFAGARFNRCSFIGATMDQCNFNGIDANSCDFSDSSLRRTRFINARLTNVRYVNCDVSGAIFSFSHREGVVFKQSNVEDARL